MDSPIEVFEDLFRHSETAQDLIDNGLTSLLLRYGYRAAYKTFVPIKVLGSQVIVFYLGGKTWGTSYCELWVGKVGSGQWEVVHCTLEDCPVSGMQGPEACQWIIDQSREQETLVGS